MIIKQLYKPDQKIPFFNYILRFLSRFIINLILIKIFPSFNNSFQQELNTYIKIKYKNDFYYFKDGHERLLWRYKTQFYEEKDLCNWIETFSEDDIFYDIGSNVGMFSIYAASRNIKTYSFEPHPANLNVLLYNLHLNKVCKKIIVLPIALNADNEISNIQFRDLTAGVAKNNITNKNIGNELNFNLITFNLNELSKLSNFEKPTKVKIDVDGLEYQILMGGSNILFEANEIMIEIYDNGNIKHKQYEKIISMLKKNNFIYSKKFKNNAYFIKSN